MAAMTADTSLQMASLHPSSASGDNVSTLAAKLQSLYSKERWTFVLDSLFSSDPAQRVSLGNAFIGTKVKFQSPHLYQLELLA